MIGINFTKIYLTEECSSLNRPFLLFVFYPIRHSNMAREAVGKKKKAAESHWSLYFQTQTTYKTG